MASVPRSVCPAASARWPASWTPDAIGHRVGKRHAQFDDVGAGLRQRLENRLAGGQVGIAGHDDR